VWPGELMQAEAAAIQLAQPGGQVRAREFPELSPVDKSRPLEANPGPLDVHVATVATRVLSRA